MPIILPTTYNVKKTHLFWLPYVQFLKFQKTIRDIRHILE